MSDVIEEEKHNRAALMAAMRKTETGIPTEIKKRRNPPGNPDPDAQVVALSPRTLLATNRYICEVCHRGFQRDQNLQLHRRGHNLPWKLKLKSSTEPKKRVYVCPELTCVHHDPNRALGDITGIKKHYSRKHGEKKWKCDKCSKKYAVQSDWKAHSKNCGTKEYRCDCGTIFTRKDSFVTCRAFCGAPAEKNYRTDHGLAAMAGNLPGQHQRLLSPSMQCLGSSITDNKINILGSETNTSNSLKFVSLNSLMQTSSNTLYNTGSMSMGSSIMSATALLQKASEMGVKISDESTSPVLFGGFTAFSNTNTETGMMRDFVNSYNNNDAQCLNVAEASSEAMNARFVPSSAGCPFVGVQNMFQTSSKGNADGSGFRTTTVRFPFGRETKIDMNNGGNLGEDNVGKRDGRMTQDFLGLAASGSMGVGSSGNSNYNEDEMYSFHQMSDGQTILGKHMWDY
ncbi:protein indeterminate-domain 2-like [Phalaenopsis equestris]|uniref:protein indeterminate-domain 2-like n=1 Tax=Phalaenopsis equestris TaxID=78828 RepID=UPI0009E589FC|nr:protein indeterminate-domain 2-like [Phalaenopsis equestris]